MQKASTRAPVLCGKLSRVGLCVELAEDENGTFDSDIRAKPARNGILETHVPVSLHQHVYAASSASAMRSGGGSLYLRRRRIEQQKPETGYDPRRAAFYARSGISMQTIKAAS